jgi:hypothetical protein
MWNLLASNWNSMLLVDPLAPAWHLHLSTRWGRSRRHFFEREDVSRRCIADYFEYRGSQLAIEENSKLT